MPSAIVLASGASTRMGQAKAVLSTPDGRPFVTRILETLEEAGLVPAIVVTGIHHDEIARACAGRMAAGQVRLVRNPDPSRGQLSSLLVGLEVAVGAGAESLLVALVDVPLVRADTVRSLVDSWRETRAPIVRPSSGGRHGHPVIFDSSVFDALRVAPSEGGARAVVRAHSSRIVDVPVDDRGCFADVDTPEDYARLLDRR